MKNTKNILFMIVIVAVIGLQVGYLLTTYKEDMSTIESLTGELRDNERYLSQLKERVAMLPETKKELELMTAQKKAMLSTIPLFDSTSKQVVEMKRYITQKDVVGASVNCSLQNSDKIDASINEHNYNVSMIGRYNDIRDFVDGLNSSYQVVNITEFSINNEIQLEAQKNSQDPSKMSLIQRQLKAVFKDDYADVVKADINFTIYSRANGEEMDEIYDPNFNMQVNKNEIFKFVDKDANGKDDEVSPSVGTDDEIQPPTPTQEYDRFTLNIGDVFTSGDTYKLGGPDGYLGLISKANTEVRLIINNAGYDMSIKDINGQEKTTHIDVDVTNPRLSIISTMRQLEDVMPSVHIYVYNYTGSVMEVDVDGSMLGNIHIFNESNKEVQKGQTNGNIKVM